MSVKLVIYESGSFYGPTIGLSTAMKEQLTSTTISSLLKQHRGWCNENKIIMEFDYSLCKVPKRVNWFYFSYYAQFETNEDAMGFKLACL